MTETYTDEITVPDLFEPSPYGLLDNVTWLNGDAAGHWRGGIQYDVDCPEADVTVSGCFPDVPNATANTKVATWEQDTRGSRAFTVFAQWDCSPPGNGLSLADLDAGRDRALKALAISAQFSVERAFWTGAVGNSPAKLYPNLTTISATPVTSRGITIQPAGVAVTGTVDVVEGLGSLEKMAANCYRGRVWIHVPAVLLPSLAARNLCYERNGRLYTYAGNRVIVGSGYLDTFGVNGATNSGVTQMYATSPVFALRDTPRSPSPKESFERGVNTVHFLAEQTYLLGWHCCLAGVTVTLGGLVSGAVSSAT